MALHIKATMKEEAAPLMVRDLWIRRSGSGGVEHMALKGVSLTLNSKECVGVAGPSGSGKTTLALAVAGFLKPYRGEVWHKGRCVASSGARSIHGRCSYVQMVFQDPFASLNPRRTLRSWFYLAQSASLGLRNEDEIRHLMDMMRLPQSRLDRYPGELSGGECQRAAIAAALAAKAKVLVLDEPTSMLDPIAKQQIEDVLLTVKYEVGIPMLVISHDLRTLASLCSRIELLWGGEIIESGEAHTLLSGSSTTEGRSLLSAWHQIQ